MLMLGLLLAAAPAIDLVAVWNQVSGVPLDPKTRAKVVGTGGCDPDSWPAEIDPDNLFVSFDGRAGPNCEEDQRHELTVFTRASGDPVILFSSYGVFGTDVTAFTWRDGKAASAPEMLEPLKPQTLLPKALRSDDPKAKAVIDRLSATYVLPKKGTTLTIKLAPASCLTLCGIVKPTPALCARGGHTKACTVRATWSAKEGRFEPAVK